MRILNHSETLMYFDNPLLIVARDQLGLDHLCLLTGTNEENDNYLCVPVSRGRLNLLLAGELDLRNIFENPETDEVFEGRAIRGDIGNIETRAIGLQDIIKDWLPESGVFLTKHQPSDNRVVQESIEKRRAIIHCTLNPPESFEESKITADHLSEAVRLFQRLIRYTYDKSMQIMGVSRQDDKKFIESPQNYRLEVFAFSPGSFTIHMQTTAPADMLGYANISRAMEIIDSISYEIDDPQHIVDTIGEFGSNFVVAYRDLLQFIVDTNTPFSYEWTMPSKKESTKAQIVPRLAKPLYEAITERTELGKEEVRLVGRFTKVDEETGNWRLVIDDNKKFYGDSYVNLGGITIETERYELICEEILETEPATKRDRKKLYLKSYRIL